MSCFSGWIWFPTGTSPTALSPPPVGTRLHPKGAGFLDLTLPSSLTAPAGLTKPAHYKHHFPRTGHCALSQFAPFAEVLFQGQEEITLCFHLSQSSALLSVSVHNCLAFSSPSSNRVSPDIHTAAPSSLASPSPVLRPWEATGQGLNLSHHSLAVPPALLHPMARNEAFLICKAVTAA